MTALSGRVSAPAVQTPVPAPPLGGTKALQLPWRRHGLPGRAGLRVFMGSRLLLCVLATQAAFVLAFTTWLHVLAPHAEEPAVLTGVLVSLATGLVLVAGWAAARGIRAHREERTRNSVISRLVSTVMDTSGEWLWALDDAGTFSFSSRASADLLGYEPSELIGRPFSLVIN